MVTTSNLYGHEAAARPGSSIFELIRGTLRSTGLDLCCTIHVMLTPEIGTQALPAGVFGPLPAETWGLLLGQSSTIVKGLQIHPCVIDNGYEGKIK